MKGESGEDLSKMTNKSNKEKAKIQKAGND